MKKLSKKIWGLITFLVVMSLMIPVGSASADFSTSDVVYQHELTVGSHASVQDNLGVGTVNPQASFVATSGDGSAAGFLAMATGLYNDAYLTLAASNNTSGSQAFNFNTGKNTPDRLDLRLLNNDLTAINDTLMTWTAGGNIGIGTVNPQYEVHIARGNGEAAGILIETTGINSDAAFTLKSDNNTAGAQAFNLNTGSSTPNVLTLRLLSDDLSVATGTLMTWNSNGNVTAAGKVTAAGLEVTGDTLVNNMEVTGDLDLSGIDSLTVPANIITDDMVVNTITASNYLPLAGGTLIGGLNGTTGSFSGVVSATGGFSGALSGNVTGDVTGAVTIPAAHALDVSAGTLTLAADQITDAMVVNTLTASNYLLLAGGTLTGTLNGTAAVFSGAVSASGGFTGNVLGNFTSLGTSSLNDLNVTTNIDTATLATTGTAAMNDFTVGGGYNNTGITASATGNLQLDGDLTVDGTFLPALVTTTTFTVTGNSQFGDGAGDVATLPTGTTFDVNGTFDVSGATLVGFPTSLASAVSLNPDTSARNVITPTAADAIGLTVRPKQGDGTANTLVLKNTADASIVTFSANGNMVSNASIDVRGSATLGNGDADAIIISGPTTVNVNDNTADVLDIQQGTANYINVNTTDGTERISFGNATTNPGFSFLGTGEVGVAGTLDVVGNVDANAGLDVTGALTVSTTGTFTGAVVANGGISNTDAEALAINANGTQKIILGGTSTGDIDLTRNTNALAGLDVTGALTVSTTSTFTGALYADGGIDRSTAAVLAIGPTNATSIALAGGYGSTGVSISSAGNLQMNGNLTVDGTTTLTGNADANGGLDVTGALTVSTTGTFTGAVIANGGISNTDSEALAINANAAQKIILGGTSTGDIDLTRNTNALAGFDVTGGALTFTGTAGSWTFAQANSALTQTGTGIVTFTGNVDATNGLDVTTANFTVGGANFIVDPATGNITTLGDLAVNGDNITSDGDLNVNGATGLSLTTTAGDVVINSAANLDIRDTIYNTTGTVIVNDAFSQTGSGNAFSVAGPATFTNTLAAQSSVNLGNGILVVDDVAAWDVTIADAKNFAAYGNVALGNTADDALTVNATSQFQAPATFNTDVNMVFQDTENLLITSTQAADVADVISLDMTSQNAGNVRGMVITANAAGTQVVDAAIAIDNVDNNAMTDAVIVTATGGDGMVVDALDASAANITNSLNVGTNNVTGTDWTVLATSDVAEALTFTLGGGVGFDVTGVAGQDFRVTNTGGSIAFNSSEAVSDAIVLNASNVTGGVDLTTGTNGFDINSTGGVVSIDGGLTAIGSDAAVGDLANGDNDLYVVGDAEVDGTTRLDGLLDLNGSLDADVTTFLVDASGTISLDSVVASNFTVTGAAQDLTLSSVGGSVNVSATEAVVDAINIDSTGGIDVDAALSINIDSAQAAATAIVLNTSSVAGGVDVNAGTGGVAIDQVGAGTGISLDAASASNFTTSAGALTLTSAAAATWSTTAGNLAVVGAGGADLTATTGTLDLLASAGSVTIAATGAASNLTITVGQNYGNTVTGTYTDTVTGAYLVDGNSTVTLDSNNATAGAVVLNASNAAGGVDVNAGTGGVAIDQVGAGTGISLDAASASNFTTSAGALTLTSAAAATWSTTAGLLTLSGTGGVNLTSGGATDITFNPASGDVVGSADNTVDLGSSSVEFKDLYIDGTAYVDAISLGGSIVPEVDNSYDLGSATNRFRDLYLGPDSLHILNTTGVNSEYLNLGFTTNVATLDISKAGSGTYRDLAINQNGSEAMRITDGKVGIGTTAPSQSLDVNGKFVFRPSTYQLIEYANSAPKYDEVGLSILSSSAETGGYASLLLNNSRNTLTSPAVLQSGDILGQIVFGGYNGGSETYNTGAQIKGRTTESWSGSTSGSKLSFYTTNSGSVQPSEKLTILDNGNVGIGATAPNNKLEVMGTTTPQTRVAYNSSNYFTQAVSAAGAVTLDATGASAGFSFSDNVDATNGLDVTGTNLTVATVADLNGSLDFDGTTFEVDASGTISLDSTVASNFTTSAGDLTLQATAASVNLNANEAATNQILLNAQGTIAGNAIVAQTTNGGIFLDANGANGALTLNSDTVTDIDSVGVLSLNSSGAAINVGDDAVAQSINIGTGASARTIRVGNAVLTNTTETELNGVLIDVNAGAGGVTIDGGASSNFTTSVGALTLNGAAGVNLVGNTAEIDATTTGLLDLNSATGTWDTSSTLVLTSGSTFDLDAVGALSLNSSAAAINMGDDAVNQGINIGTGGVRTVTVGNVAATEVQVDGLLLDLNAGATGMTVDSGATIDLQATTGVTIDSAGATTIGIGTDANTGTINVGTAGVRTVNVGNVLATEVQVDALLVDVNAGAGGATIDAAGASNFTTSAGALTLSGAGGLNLAGTAASEIDATTTGLLDLNSGTGTWNTTTTLVLTAGSVFDLDATGALSLNSSAAAINMGDDAVNQGINIGTGGVRTITVGNDAATKVDVNALAIELDSAGVVDIDATTALSLNTLAAQAINIGNDAVAQSVLLGNAAATEVDATAILVDVNGGTGGITVDSGAALAVNAVTTIDLQATTGLTLDSAGATTIAIGTDANTGAINIGTSATARTITVGNAASTEVETNATTVDVNAGTGGVSIDQVGAGTGISLDAASASNFTTSAGALSLTSAEAATWSTVVGALSLNTTTDQAITVGAGAFTQEAVGGQVTFTGNVDATNGLDVTTANLTVGGTNFTVAQATGEITVAPSQGLDTNAAGQLRLGQTNATSVSVCESAACDAVSIANNDETSNTIAIGHGGNDTLSINGQNFDLGTAGGVTIENSGNNTMLTLDGTNVTTSAMIDLNTKNTSGDIINVDYAGATVPTGAVTGFDMDLSNLSGAAQIIYAYHTNTADDVNTTTVGLAMDGSVEFGIDMYAGATALTVSTADVRLSHSETISNATDDIVVLAGTAGADDTDLYIDLDGVSPLLYSTADSNIMVNDNLLVGVTTLTENITNAGFTLSGDDLYVEDQLGVDGAAYFDSTVDFAGAVTFNSTVATGTLTVTGDVVPEAAGTRNLGSATAEWAVLYMDDDTGIYFGLDQNALLAYDETTDDRVELTGANASLYVEDVLGLGKQEVSTAAGSPQDYPQTVTTSYMEVSFSADDHDTISLLTATAKEGDTLVIVNVGANHGGVLESTTAQMSAASLVFDQYDSITFIFDGTYWIELSASNNTGGAM